MANRRNELNEGYIEGLRAARRIVERALRESDEWSGEGLPYEVDGLPKGSILYNVDVDDVDIPFCEVRVSIQSIYAFDVYGLVNKVADAIKSAGSLGVLVKTDAERARFTGREVMTFMLNDCKLGGERLEGAFRRAVRFIPQMKFDASVPKRPY